MVVAAAFAAMATVFGVAYSFGAFFDPMATEFGAGHAATSVVFGVTVFVWFSLGAFTGWAGDRFGTGRVVFAGAIALGLGLWLTSLVRQLWLGYVTYGAGVGIGVACGYVPAVAAAGSWFRRHQGLAIGVAVSGIGVGTLIGPVAAAWLIGVGGWRWAYQVLAIAGFVILAAAALLTTKPRATGAPELRVGPAIRSWPFGVIYLSIGLQGFGLWTFFAFLAPYAEAHGASRVAAAWLIGAVGVGSTVGRLAFGPIADRFGRIRTFQAAVLAMALVYAYWLTAPSYAGLAALAVAMGAAYGGWVAITPSVFAELFGARELGTLTGFAYTAAGVGALFGPPLAGLIVDRTGGYSPAIGFALALQAAAFAVILLLRSPAGAGRSEPGKALGR